MGIDRRCPMSSRVWNVAKIDVENLGKEKNYAGEETGNDLYGIRIVDGRYACKTRRGLDTCNKQVLGNEPLRLVDLPTQEARAPKQRPWDPFEQVYFNYASRAYPDKYLDTVCYGRCHPAEGAEGYAKCLSRFN